MSSARTQRHSTIGTLCRRSTALLLPLSPLVLLVFLAVTVVTTVRTGLAARSAASLEDAAPEPVAASPSTRVTRGIAATRPTPRRVLGGTAALMGGILVAASMAGGTYAFLNAQATTPAVTVSSGNLAVTVQYGSGTAGPSAAIPATAWSNMLPGDIVGQQVTVANSGSASATLSFRLAATTAWDVRVAWGTCPTTQITNGALTTTAMTGSTIAGGFSSTMCVQAVLPASAAASAEATTVPFTMIIDAKQVAP